MLYSPLLPGLERLWRGLWFEVARVTYYKEIVQELIETVCHKLSIAQMLRGCGFVCGEV
jgi:hypothetical protein